MTGLDTSKSQINTKGNDMADGNENTGADPALTTAAGYARECMEWQEKQMVHRRECANNIQRYLEVNPDLSVEDRKFHEREQKFEAEQSAKHQRWANGIRALLLTNDQLTNAEGNGNDYDND